MTGFDVYLITRLDSMKELFEVIMISAATVGSITGILWAICACEDIDEKEMAKFCRRICKTAILILCLIAIPWVALPTSKEMAAIIVLPKIANSEAIKEIPENISTLANEWTKSKIKEINE